MKKFKNFLVGLLVVIIGMVVIAYLLPRHVHVERTGTINASAKVVFSQVNNLRTWDKWAVWMQMDPDIEVAFENTGIGKGAAYNWNSENPHLGSGKLTITESVPYDSIATEMNFMEEGISTSYFLFEEKHGQTEITWAFDTDLGNNPVARWMGLFFESMIGSDFEKGIENLKIVAEIIVQEGRPIVEIVRLPEFKYVSLREEIELEAVSTKMGEMYSQLINFVDRNDLSMTDMPYSIYHKIDGNRIDLEFGIPIDYEIEPQGQIRYGKMASKSYATADHIGSYENLEKTHSFIQRWISENGLTLDGSPMEKYQTDPQQQPDESKWVTVIYYPVR